MLAWTAWLWTKAKDVSSYRQLHKLAIIEITVIEFINKRLTLVTLRVILTA